MDALDRAPPPAEEAAAMGNSLQAALWHLLDYLVHCLCGACAGRNAQQELLLLQRDASLVFALPGFCFQSRALDR